MRFFSSRYVIDRLSNTPNRVLILHGVQDQIMPGVRCVVAWERPGGGQRQGKGGSGGLFKDNTEHHNTRHKGCISAWLHGSLSVTDQLASEHS